MPDETVFFATKQHKNSAIMLILYLQSLSPMFIGHLQQENELLPEKIHAVLTHIRATDYAHYAPGKYPIDGEKIFAIVQDPITQSWESGYPEFHARYIDVQLLLEGEEVIGYLPADPTLALKDNHLQDRDIAFVAPQANETKIVLTAGMYAIFYPGELHRPCRTLHQAMQIKKLVIKIEAK